MNTTKEQRKEKAIELMTQLGIYKPYIKDFKEQDTVCFYENFAGFWAWQDEELRFDGFHEYSEGIIEIR